MKKSIITLVLMSMFLFFGQIAFSQVEFEIQNTSGYRLYGFMISQDGGEDWTEDLLLTEFPSNTTATVIIPENYTCTIFVKVIYKVNDVKYEELLGTADVCNHSGIQIIKNEYGESGDWMDTQYLD